MKAETYATIILILSILTIIIYAFSPIPTSPQPKPPEPTQNITQPEQTNPQPLSHTSSPVWRIYYENQTNKYQQTNTTL